MKKKLSFYSLLGIWFIAALVLFLLNSMTLKSSICHSIILASLGIILLVYPVYPEALEAHYSADKCRKFIRIIAIVEIVLSFWGHTTF